MTYKEYISAVLSKFNISESEVDVIILDNTIGSDDDVDIVVAKKAIHKNLTTWLPIQSSVSEGGVSLNWNIEAIKLYYSALCKELNLSNVIAESNNTISDKSNIW